jgi:hypothetical protein
MAGRLRLPVAARVRLRLTPWWWRVAAIFVASRVVSTAILLVAAARQGANPWTGPSPSYPDFATIWDGTWYRIIAAAGYPSVLPVTDDGRIGENAWAFMPVYPGVVGVLQRATGLEFGPLAVLVAAAFALGAALVFYRLMRRRLPEGSAYFAVVLFCVAPLSPILQVAYAESMQLFFLLLALLLLLDRRYVLMVPVVAVMALTRPSGLAFALLLLLHLIHRFATRRRDPFPLRQRIEAVGLGLFTALCGAAWPLIAWAATGLPTAYTDTELAWRAPYIGDVELVPFTPWIQGAEWWMRWLVPSEWSLPVGALLLVVVLLGFVAFLFSPWAKRLGVDLRLWLVAYALYLLAVFFPQSSTFRLLMPLAPGLGALAVPRALGWRVLLVLLGIAGQVVWVRLGWWVDGADWTPP